MKYSIRRQFAGIFIGLMAAAILFCWFLNSTFLQKYYISNKKAVLLELHGDLVEAVGDNRINTEEFELILQQKCSKYNLALLVLDANSQVVEDSGGGADFLKQQLLQHLFALSSEQYEIMDHGDGYIIAQVKDTRAQMEYIEIWGVLPGGYFFIIRSALEGIRDSVQIANRFLAFVGIFACVLSGILIWYVSRRITNPILQLADISKRMSHLDFTARYVGTDVYKRQDLNDLIPVAVVHGIGKVVHHHFFHLELIAPDVYGLRLFHADADAVLLCQKIRRLQVVVHKCGNVKAFHGNHVVSGFQLV